MAHGRKAPIPITLVAGARGAGKTTLINRLLATPEFADTAVILNDFGRTDVKGGAIARAEDGYIALGSGCVCCSVRGALVDSLEGLLRDLDNRRIARVGRVILEADEAADPASIVAAVERHPYLSLRYAAEGIATVLDPATLADVLDRRAETVRQVAMADWLVFSGEPDAGAFASLNALNPAATVLKLGNLEPGMLAHPPAEPGIDADAWLRLPAGFAPSGLAGEAGRARAFAVVRPGAMSFASLDRFVEYLVYLQAPSLLRVRGIVSTGEGEATLVDGIGGHFRPPQVIDREGAPSITFAVTARDLAPETLAGYIDAFVGEMRVDRDGRPLSGNPLAIAGFSARSGG